MDNILFTAKFILQIFETFERSKKMRQIENTLFLDILSNKITKETYEKYGLEAAYYIYIKNIDKKTLDYIIEKINKYMYEENERFAKAIKREEENIFFVDEVNEAYLNGENIKEERKAARGNTKHANNTTKKIIKQTNKKTNKERRGSRGKSFKEESLDLIFFNKKK